MSNPVSEDLYHKVSRFPGVGTFDAEGNSVDYEEATIFQVPYGGPGLSNIITINITDGEMMYVQFDRKLTDSLDDADDREKFYEFLDELRDFASSRFDKFKVNDIVKTRSDKNNYTAESRMYGSKRRSYHEGSNGTKLIIKHNKPVSEEVRGSRSRNIKSIHVETSQGERFLMPRNHLPTARAMARHIANEGSMNDDIGKAIVEMHDDMMDFRQFNRRFKNTSHMMEGADDILEATKEKYHELKSTLETIQKQTGYASFVENFEPPAINEDEEEVTEDFSDLKTKLTKNVFEYDDDDFMRIAPKVQKAYTDKENRDAEQADQVARERSESRTNAILALDSIDLDGSPSDNEKLHKQFMDLMSMENMKNGISKKAKNEMILKKFEDEVLNGVVEQGQMKFTHSDFDLITAIESIDLDHSGMFRDDDAKKKAKNDKAMVMHLFLLWIKGQANVSEAAELKTENEVFEEWADRITEMDAHAFHAAADELYDYAYDSDGNPDHDIYIKMAEYLEDEDNLDAVEKLYVDLSDEGKDEVDDILNRWGIDIDVPEDEVDLSGFDEEPIEKDEVHANDSMRSMESLEEDDDITDPPNDLYDELTDQIKSELSDVSGDEEAFDNVRSEMIDMLIQEYPDFYNMDAAERFVDGIIEDIGADQENDRWERGDWELEQQRDRELDFNSVDSLKKLAGV